MQTRIFSPTIIGQFTITPPTDLAQPADGTIQLILGSKGAFGSGDHETTTACLELLPTIPGLVGSRALDLGSGTGILAIAAARLGVAATAAVDLFWDAARSCQENIRLNGVDQHVQTICGELGCLHLVNLDLVMANIYADILLPLADQLVAATRPGGHILLSGIPLQDKFDVWRRYANLGCNDVDSRIGEEYATYLLRKGSSATAR
jgi:ribosomal protein L11 methyltransferase